MKNEKKKIRESVFVKPEKLIDLIEYQEESVVSRTLIDKEAGTVSLFAFDKGQGLSEHTAPFDAIVYSLDCLVEVTISDKKVNLKKGDIVIMPANEPHALKAIDRFKMLLVMIRQ